MFSYSVEHYRLDMPLAEFLCEDDSVFVSPRGTFISRGCIEMISSTDVVETLASIVGTNPYDEQPFLVFGHDFQDVADYGEEPEQVFLPENMIHIDNDWVTHFHITSDDTRAFSSPETASTPLVSPHHIEISSPESQDQFVEKVRTILKHIEVGEVTKVVLARQLFVSADVPIDLRLLVTQLMDTQPESFVYSVNGFVGASPELLVEKFSRAIRCLPMAGTRRRHARIDDDDADIADLQTNVKDRAEHSVVIDDIVKKLGDIANNVSASNVPHVVRLPHVAHLATSVTATADIHTDLMEFVDALHPTPAVAGTPTLRAMEIITDVEGFSRDNYGAPVGWINASGDGQCAIALRCARVQGAHAQLFAGVGIVAGSDPLAEWNETQAKFGVMRDALLNITQ